LACYEITKYLKRNSFIKYILYKNINFFLC